MEFVSPYGVKVNTLGVFKVDKEAYSSIKEIEDRPYIVKVQSDWEEFDSTVDIDKSLEDQKPDVLSEDSIPSFMYKLVIYNSDGDYLHRVTKVRTWEAAVVLTEVIKSGKLTPEQLDVVELNAGYKSQYVREALIKASNLFKKLRCYSI